MALLTNSNPFIGNLQSVIGNLQSVTPELSAAQIKALYESNADTYAFTEADKQRLSNAVQSNGDLQIDCGGF